MSGNVNERCSDWEGDYNNGAQINPKGPKSGTTNILRGGSFLSGDYWTAVVNRNSISLDYYYYTHGFRLGLPHD